MNNKRTSDRTPGILLSAIQKIWKSSPVPFSNRR